MIKRDLKSRNKKKEEARPIREKVLDKNKKKRNLRPVDKYLLVIILALLLFGIITLFSASLVTAHSSHGDAYFYVKKQIFSLIIGTSLLFLLMRLDYHFFKKYSLVFLIASFVFLTLVFVPGLASDHGTAKSWIIIFGKSFQVSEAVKLFLIFYLAAWVESRKDDLKKFSTGLFPFLIVISIIGLLFLLQPDLGTFILVFLIALSIYFIADGNIKQLLIMFLIAVTFSAYFFSSLGREVPDDERKGSLIHSYQLNRVRCLQNPDFDSDICYQVNQSLIAVGSGGLWGRGLGNSRQKFNYLPEVWSDSIFPVIAEELGFIGALFLVFVYLFIFYKGMMIAKRAPDMYGRALATGISVWIFSQAFLNIGGMINLIPMTGVVLPFVSAGGTSLLMLLIACGILLNIGRHGNSVGISKNV